MLQDTCEPLLFQSWNGTSSLPSWWRTPPHQDGPAACASTCGSPLSYSCSPADVQENVHLQNENFRPSTLQYLLQYSRHLLQHCPPCSCHRNCDRGYFSSGSLQIHLLCTLGSCLCHREWWGVVICCRVFSLIVFHSNRFYLQWWAGFGFVFFNFFCAFFSSKMSLFLFGFKPWRFPCDLIFQPGIQW